MNYDQHRGRATRQIPAEDWFLDNLKDVLKIVPKEKIICSLGSYGYDSACRCRPGRRSIAKAHQALCAEGAGGQEMSTQDAWQAADNAEAQIQLDPDSLNVHFAYDDDDAHVRHQVWFLDAVTMLDQMRAARALGIETFALWRLGSEDNSLWKIWQGPVHADPVLDLAQVAPGFDVNTEGEGDILHIERKMQTGRRAVTLDDDDSVPLPFRSVTAESMTSYPLSFTIQQTAITPIRLPSASTTVIPKWTPLILDILKKYHVVGAFFMIGEEAQNNISLMQRVYNEGHEIGNHTFTHPGHQRNLHRQIALELKLTEQLFGSKLGVQPLYFRPPYSIDPGARHQ